MGQYKVRILPAAKEDMTDIVDYPNTLSPEAAFRYYDLLTKKISSLSDMPERWGLVPTLGLAHLFLHDQDILSGLPAVLQAVHHIAHQVDA
jgi:plasmid stabilization system protein ParE